MGPVPAARSDLGRDRGNLCWSFAKAQDDFWEALADGAVMIDAREAQILKGGSLKRAEDAALCLGRIHPAVRDTLKQGAQIGRIHDHGPNC